MNYLLPQNVFINGKRKTSDILNSCQHTLNPEKQIFYHSLSLVTKTTIKAQMPIGKREYFIFFKSKDKSRR